MQVSVKKVYVDASPFTFLKKFIKKPAVEAAPNVRIRVKTFIWPVRAAWCWCICQNNSWAWFCYLCPRKALEGLGCSSMAVRYYYRCSDFCKPSEKKVWRNCRDQGQHLLGLREALPEWWHSDRSSHRYGWRIRSRSFPLCSLRIPEPRRTLILYLKNQILK